MRLNRFVILAILLATQFAMADTVVTKDGRTLDGRIVTQNDDKIVMEITKYGANMQVALNRNDVVSLKESSVFRPAAKAATKPAATSRSASGPAGGSTTKSDEGATYYLIPIKGEIGKDVQKEVIREALRSARSKKATYVIFQIDSPGGSVGETEEILGLMTEKSDQRRMALVSKALSSAAVLSMACPDIFVEPGATIGAAVPMSSGPTPQPIEEKVLSAIRAMARSAAEVGNHNTLLIQGMMEMDMELGLTTKDGKPVVAAGHDGKVLKPKGQILTLTAHEAVDCGLARDVVSDEAAIGKSLGLARWTDVTGLGKAMNTDLSRKGKATAERTAYLESVKLQLDKINTDLEKVTADLEAAQANRDLLNKQFETEKANAKAQFDQAMIDARGHMQDVSIGMQSQARATYNGAISSLLARYSGSALSIQDSITKLTIQKKQLTDQRNRIMLAAPKIPAY
jgi:ATP-dependent protease ClpP protease subunit